MKIKVLLLLLVLSGCISGVEYDNQELVYLTEARFIVSEITCSGDETLLITRLVENTSKLMMFTEYASPGPTHEAAIEINNLATEFYKRVSNKADQVSYTYCQIKKTGLLSSLESIGSAVGRKIR